MASIVTRNLNQGGIADSDYLGNENSAAEIVNLDIHEESGIIKCSQALVDDSGDVVDEMILASVPCSNGSSYHFGISGGVFERESDGTWTDHGTVAPSSGGVAVLGAEEYQGYIYYAMEDKLGRFAIPTGGTAPTRSDNWATFGVTDADFHPMMKNNLVLYIGDGNQVAQVDAGTFSANALDITQPLRISSLGKLDTDLLIGTFVSDNVNRTEIIRWNTWSVSFSVSDPIPEVGVNAFFDTDNIVVVNAGTKGNLYIYDGAQLEHYKQIKGDWSGTNKAKVNPYSTYNHNGRPLFGLSNISGDGVKLGVYSLARTGRDYPYVLALEHVISSGSEYDVQITTITPISADQFLVAWYDNSHPDGGAAVAVDVLSLTQKATGYFTTRMMTYDRTMQNNYGHAHAPYRTLPDSAEINFYKNANYENEDFTDAAEASMTDTERLKKQTEQKLGSASAIQVRCELVPNGNNGPEVEELSIDVQA